MSKVLTINIVNSLVKVQADIVMPRYQNIVPVETGRVRRNILYIMS
jgi:hypothetical protein